MSPNIEASRKVRKPWSVCLLGLAALLPSGCITSPAWENGATPVAKQTLMNACPNGMIDDLEDGDAQGLKIDNRGGYWYTYVDKFGSTIVPKKFMPEAGGPPGSKLAAHIKGQIAANGDWPYAGVGLALSNPKAGTDVAKAAGIRFWGKGPGRIHFELPDANTDPSGDRCKDCYNHFGVYLALEAEWNRYTIPFDRFAQDSGWGDRAAAVAEKELIAIQWKFASYGQPYDLWFDNVELVGCDLAQELP
jgi:hypothetical protein